MSLFRSSALLAVLTLGATFAAQLDQDAQKIRDAQKSGETWLALVDARKYPESWTQASSFFRARVSRQQWVDAIRGVRIPLGAVSSRQMQNVSMAKTLPGAPDGDYAVIRFETSFEHKTSAIETLTMALDRGQWRAAGYFIK